jgi:hypothetical protein
MTDYRISSKVTALRDGRFLVFAIATALGGASAESMTESTQCQSSAQAEARRQEISRRLADFITAAGGRIVSVEIA